MQKKNMDYTFIVLDSNDWVNVIPLTSDNKVVLIKQYRAGVDGFTLEIPGGLVENDEDPVKAGLRELVEETGYVAESFKSLGWVHPNPAIQNNKCHLVLAKNCTKKQQPHFDSTEDIETVITPLNDVNDLIQNGKITHSLVLNAFYLMGIGGKKIDRET